MKLEPIVPSRRLTGVIGDGTVEVLSVRTYGPRAVEVAWRGPEGLGESILFREDEARRREVTPGAIARESQRASPSFTAAY